MQHFPLASIHTHPSLLFCCSYSVYSLALLFKVVQGDMFWNIKKHYSLQAPLQSAGFHVIRSWAAGPEGHMTWTREELHRWCRVVYFWGWGGRGFVLGADSRPKEGGDCTMGE